MSHIPATAQRTLEDLRVILLWEGEIDNLRIREIAGVKTVWASRLLAALTEACADIAERQTSHAPLRLKSASRKRGVAASPDAYLRALAIQGPLPSMLEDCRRDLSVVRPDVFAALAQATRQHGGVHLRYASMTRPEGTERVIYPHAIVRAPRRWHVRAWCSESKAFRDFNLGRIAVAQGVEGNAPKQRADDADWNKQVTVNVIAHPHLSSAQQAVVAQEFYPHAAARALTMRRCLVGYVIQDLNIATDPERELPPRFQLCVADPAKILPLFATNAG